LSVIRENPYVASMLPRVVGISDISGRARGICRGRQLSVQILKAVEAYRQLFQSLGGVPDLEQLVAESRTKTENWWPSGAEEIDGIAEGSGIDALSVWMLNCRTELLAEIRRRSGVVALGECSVAIHAEPPTVGIQTWDWHEHMAGIWHPIKSHGGIHNWCGITEAGILAKIGVNSSGLGLHLDILFHNDDRAGGVPIHVVAARVLAEAGSVEEAIEIARSAGVSASSALSVHDGISAASIEVSGAGVEVVQPEKRWLVHTNRFRSPKLKENERNDGSGEEGIQDAVARERKLLERVDGYKPILATSHLLKLLESDFLDEGWLSCVPKSSANFGDRWHTLVTIMTRPDQGLIEFKAGLPGGQASLRVLRI